MTVPLTFPTTEAYVAHRSDASCWAPHLADILDRHGIGAPEVRPEPGYNATYPTFLWGPLVVKLYGHVPTWRSRFRSERAAHRQLATDPAIRAAALLFDGALFEDEHAPWPYLVLERLDGQSWEHQELTEAQRHDVAAALGEQVRRVQTLPVQGVEEDDDWAHLDLEAAARRSSFPAHLVPGIPAFVDRVQGDDHVFTHGDIVAMHVLVEDGTLAGILDWGDAAVTDPHYELVQLFFSTFRCDKALLGTFLEAADWEPGPDFANRVLACALRRQAVGLTQHLSMDVFHALPEALPEGGASSFDALASSLFEA